MSHGLDLSSRLSVGVGFTLAAGLVSLLALPVVMLAASTTMADLQAGLRSPDFSSALELSAWTTTVSLFMTVLAGTPLAWWLATSSSGWARLAEVVVALPIVVPPAVVGVGLLMTFGRRGVFGPLLASFGVTIPFTEAAVLLAQLVVSSPFYVQAAANAFRKVDRDLLVVARTLGASTNEAFFRVAVPVALPGLIVGASLAWARALGEFGATLLFAGNRVGTTQTLPLAIFAALETDVSLASVFSIVLAAIAAGLLLVLRFVPELARRRREVGS